MTSYTPQPQVPQYFDAVQGLDVRVEVGVPDAHLRQVVSQFFGHALGQCGDQAAFRPVHPLLDSHQEVVDLAPGGLDFDGRVQQARGGG